MKCSELQLNLSLFADGLLGETESASIGAHLESCPLCRQAASDLRQIRSELRQVRRPEISATLKNKISESVRSEIHREKRSWLPVAPDIREWLQMRVMPYGIGVFASLLIGVTFLTMMFSGMLATDRVQNMAKTGQSTIMLAANTNPYSDTATYDVISPTDFAKTRMAYSTESPSVNPEGALIAMTKSFIRGGMKDDEVVVVADVFSNGLAQVTEIVEPSRDRQAMVELQKALTSDPAFAPFVTADMDDRPESVRVVLKFQSVNVDTNPKRNRARL
jgi:hypothetical protein